MVREKKKSAGPLTGLLMIVIGIVFADALEDYLIKAGYPM